MKTILIQWGTMEFEYDLDLYYNLATYIKAMREYNQDIVILFDGKEGAGKSTLMRQTAAVYCYIFKKNYNIDIPFGIQNIHFELESYMKAANNDEKTKYMIHILDESRAIANRRRSVSSSNVLFTNYMSECRSSNHLHMIALPAFHDIDANIAIWRTVFVVHLKKYFKKPKQMLNEDGSMNFPELVLGEFEVFANNKAFKNCYYHKLKYVYPRKPIIKGAFKNIEVLSDIDEYEFKKDEARKAKYANLQKETKSKRDLAIYKAFTEKKMLQKDIADIFELSVGQIKAIVGEVRKEGFM